MTPLLKLLKSRKHIIKDLSIICHLDTIYPENNIRNKLNLFLEDRPVIFRGSLNSGKKAKQQAWYPGVICHPKNFNCSTYYTYWGKWMLYQIIMYLMYLLDLTQE